jgi:hypothetical protein
MPSPTVKRVPPLLGALIVTSCVFLVGFEWSRRASQREAERKMDSEIRFLTHLLGQKDDMGLIDWSRGFGSDRTLAFQVASPVSILSSGGDLSRLPPHPREGASFDFPSEVVLKRSFRSPEGPLVLILREKASIPPLPTGMLAGGLAALCFLMGLRSSWPRRSPIEGPGPVAAGEPPPFIRNAVEGESRLILDHGLGILEFTSQAMEHLAPGRMGPPPSHLLDLAPSRELMVAIEKGDPVAVTGAFPSRPELVAEVTKGPTDIRILLRVAQGPGDPKIL